MASENKKKPRPLRAARQFLRTAQNTRKRRDKHAKRHPNDKAARANWDAHPPRTAAK